MGEHKNWSELSLSSSSQLPLKKMIPQLLLSVSIFSFIFSFSSLYTSSNSSSFFVHSPKLHFFSANYFQLMRCALNKNCLFFICNGLLVFLAKTSGFIGPPSDYDNNFNDMLQKKIGLEDPKETLGLDDKYYVSEENCDDEPKDDQEDGERDEEESGRGKEVSIFIAESEEEGRAGDVEKDDELTAETRRLFWLFDDDEDQEQLYGQQVEEEEGEEEHQDDDDEEEEEKVELSTQELNQKFEDFIRRMKEEIIINEARQKVVINM